jgi:hypothetical protein
VAETSVIASSLAPGVALTSAVIYWANLQGRLDNLSTRVRSLNGELRGSVAATRRALSVQRQVQMLTTRSRVLHAGVVLAVVALLAFLASSAVLFVTLGRHGGGVVAATILFMLGLAALGTSLALSLWEMLWSYRSLEEDVRSSRPLPGPDDRSPPP